MKIINEIDLKILGTLNEKEMYITELTSKINIAPVNMWKHLNSLKELELIHVPEAKKGCKKILNITSKGRDLLKILK